MDAVGEKAPVLGDYSALLRALLPGFRGFRCYSQNGSNIWNEEPSPPVPLTTGYGAALAGLLTGTTAGAVRVDLDGAVAYLVALRSGADPLGAVTIIMSAGAAMLTAEAFATVVLPATRTLAREMTLRIRLIESYRKLSVQAAEERLLHDVDRAVQGPPDCKAMFGRILGLCCHFLQIRTAALLIPEKSIALVNGEDYSRAELETLLELDDEAANEESKVRYVARIKGPNNAPVGVLVLAGWSGPEFSVRRRSRVGRYVVAHIEAVLSRAYDNLTGLTAWPVFEKLLVAAAANSAVQPATLMYFDVDQLHVANDTLGHEAGDKVLVGFAAALREELQGHASTRIASDRFAALLLDTDLETARQFGERIAARFRRLEFGQADRRYRASVSIGIGSAATDSTLVPDADVPADAGCLATAQVACRAAKDRGRDRVEVYQSDDLSIVQRFDDIQLVGFIRNAIEHGRMTLLGQPLVAVKPGAGAGTDHPYFEVLVRMLGDDDQQILPSNFMPAAERYQLMEDLDRWVVANTLELLGRNAPALTASGARFAINLSGQSLSSEAFLGFVQQELKRSAVPPAMVCFEITETVAVANLQRAQTFMHTLRGAGCHFSLDDFGTGLSSFAYLKLFPVDTLKIDGSFIRDLTTNVVSQSMVAAISEVARVMRLDSVAEFVEDQATLNLLSKLGITWAQGYLLGEPGRLADHIGSLLASHPAAEPGRSVETGRG